MTDPATVAAGLSGPMRSALDRYGRAFVWADGRSTKALIRRGLVRVMGRDPELFGDTALCAITPFGAAVRKILEAQDA